MLFRSYFHKGTVHVDNSVEGIYAGVVHMRREWGRFDREVKELREERKLEWARNRDALMTMIRQAIDD